MRFHDGRIEFEGFFGFRNSVFDAPDLLKQHSTLEMVHPTPVQVAEFIAQGVRDGWNDVGIAVTKF